MGLLLLAAACGGSGGDARGRAVEADSAGILVVTSTVPAWDAGETWRVDTTPELVIGDATKLPSVLLVWITGARRLANGHVVVVSDDDQSIRWFDQRGAEIRRVARSGSGPGEFRHITLVGMLGDSLLLWDGQLDRATVLTRDGEPARTIELRADSGVVLDAPVVSDLFADGRLLVAGQSRAVSTMASALRRDSIPLAIASPDGHITRVLTQVPGHENVVVTGAGFVTMLPRPFGARTLVAADDASVLVSPGDLDEVVRYAADGSVAAIYRVERPRRLITELEIEQQRLRLAEQVKQLPAPIDQAVADAMAGVSVPRVYPAHDRMLVDAVGAIWLREDIGPRRTMVENHRWTVLDRDGHWLGTVTTPARLEVQQISRDRIVGIWRDINDVEHLRVHRLER